MTIPCPETLEALLPETGLPGPAATPDGAARAAGDAFRTPLFHLTRQALVPSSPRAAGETHDALGTLARLLATFSGLPAVLADDHHWHQFTETM